MQRIRDELEDNLEDAGRQAHHPTTKGNKKGDKLGDKLGGVFPLICGSGGSKISLLDQKLKAVVARKFGSEKIKKHRTIGALLGVEMSKNAHRCGAKHASKSK